MSRYLFYYTIMVLITYSNSSCFAQSDDAWEIIFNGENLKGWSVIEKPANVSVKDSAIVLRMTAHTSRHAYVRTNKKYKDFIFEVDFKRDRTLDSGILFRSESTPDTSYCTLFGYQMKIDPSLTRLWTGGTFLDFGKDFTWLYPLEGDNRARHAEKEGGEWNHVRIEAIGQHLKVWLNGIPTTHLIDDTYKEGYIAFKMHWLKEKVENEKLEISYKNIRIMTENLEEFTRKMDIPPIDLRKKT